MIDIMRGLAASAVALFHFNATSPTLPDIYHQLCKWGWLGVPVFFVISGYCVTAARENSGALTFYFRRLARIFPPYWASLAVVLAIVGLRVISTGVNDVTPLPKTPVESLYTILALTAPATSVQGMNWVYWSLAYELAFYLLLGSLWLWRPVAALAGFSLVAALIPAFPFNQWGLFGLGIACRYIVQQKRIPGAIIGALCATAAAFRLSTPQTIAGMLTAGLIVFPPRIVLRSAFQPLRAVGQFSYSLYLLHVPIGVYLIGYYQPWLPSRAFAPSLLQDAIRYLGSICAAYLLYRLVEAPVHRWARQTEIGPGSAQTAASVLALPNQSQTLKHPRESQ